MESESSNRKIDKCWKCFNAKFEGDTCRKCFSTMSDRKRQELEVGRLLARDIEGLAPTRQVEYLREYAKEHKVRKKDVYRALQTYRFYND